MASKMSTETSSSPPTASSTYANVLSSLKEQQHQEKNENNKENIENVPEKKVENEAKSSDSPSGTTAAVATPEEPHEDDASFVPVLPHPKRDRKNRQRNRGPHKERTDVGGAPPVAKEKRAANTSRNKSRRSGDGPERTKDNENKDKPLDSAAENSTTTRTSSEDDEKDSTVPKKFVEAPLPKVNAWKVSTILRSCYCIFRCFLFGKKPNINWTESIF